MRVVRNTIFRKAPHSVVSGYGNGQKERLCLIIDKCRRQKLCKQAQIISVAAPLRVKYFEFRHFRPHYLDVDTIFGDLGMNACSKKHHI
jgi:hypothetical protein